MTKTFGKIAQRAAT